MSLPHCSSSDAPSQQRGLGENIPPRVPRGSFPLSPPFLWLMRSFFPCLSDSILLVPQHIQAIFSCGPSVLVIHLASAFCSAPCSTLRDYARLPLPRTPASPGVFLSAPNPTSTCAFGFAGQLPRGILFASVLMAG